MNTSESSFWVLMDYTSNMVGSNAFTKANLIDHKRC